MSDDDYLSLPPVKSVEPQKKATRPVQLTVPTETFLKLELDGARRGMSSYKLAAVILTMYVNGRLILKPDGTQATECAASSVYKQGDE